MPESIFTELDLYILVPEPISTAYFINPFYQFVCLCLSPLIVARHWLKVTFPWKQIRAIIEELLEASFSIRSTYIKEASVSMSVYPPIVARQWLGKCLPAAKKNCLGCRFV
jgi:hypothetical protein